MTKSYFSTGRYVIIYSGLCVLKGLIGLSDKGVFSCAVIKKRRYYPSMETVNDMDNNSGEPIWHMYPPPPQPQNDPPNLYLGPCKAIFFF